MKLLFVMASPEYLRFYDTAIDALAARGHDVSIAVNNQREKKPVGLEGLRARDGRVNVIGVAPAHDGMWGEIAYGLRGTIDFVHYLHPRFAAAPALRARMKRKVLPTAYRWLDRIPRLSEGMVRGVERLLMEADRSLPISRDIVEFLRQHKPDVLLVSPLVDAASEQVDWIKAARACGIRSAACIASWDNLTNKGLLRIEPDLVIVWNEAQKREAHLYHYIPEHKVATTGAQLFDRWFDNAPTRDRAAFCARVGLPDTRPFLLFTGSSSFISETHAEVAFVRRWVTAIRSSGDAALRDINILVRPHPYNCVGWEEDPATDLPGVAVYPRQGYNPIDEQNRADFFDSLYHAAAVVGINTSAMIEAAIIGRPVFSLLAEEFAGTQELTIHFHHLLPENGGFLRVASSLDEHVGQLNAWQRDPATAIEQTARFVTNFIRPHGLARPATDVFVDVVERLAAMPAPRPAGVSPAAVVLRPMVLAGTIPAALVAWLNRPDPLASIRKRARKTLHRTRKSVGKTTSIASSRMRRGAKLASKQWQKSVVKPLRARR